MHEDDCEEVTRIKALLDKSMTIEEYAIHSDYLDAIPKCEGEKRVKCPCSQPLEGCGLGPNSRGHDSTTHRTRTQIEKVKGI